MNFPADIWPKVLSLMEGDMTATTINTWFDDATPVALDANRFVLHTPSNFKRDIIMARYLPVIQKALHELFSADFEVVVLGEGELEDFGKKKTDDVFLPGTEEYTFERFVVGASNKFAHAAAQAVAERPAQTYNPLFIYGESGLGKTHLLYAIAHKIHQNHPDYRIVYIKGDSFTNELIQAIREGRNPEFREKYRSADVFLMDDVQFIAGRESTQEEMFHTFNTLYESKKQIIISSDKPPKEIETLEERLRSRFEWGLTVDIQSPDYETRMAILRKKEEMEGYNIDNEVIKYIATNIKSNIRELEGALTKIVALSRLNKCDITLELAEEALKDIISPNAQREVTPELIIQVVSDHFGITPADVISQKRTKDIVYPRQIIMYLCRTMTETSLQIIGRSLGKRDHTTVLHGADKITSDMQKDETLRNTIDILKKKINPQ